MSNCWFSRLRQNLAPRAGRAQYRTCAAKILSPPCIFRVRPRSVRTSAAEPIPFPRSKGMRNKVKLFVTATTLAAFLGWLFYGAFPAGAARPAQTLSAPFQRRVLETPPEAPFELRFFTTAVKTDSRGRVITGPTSDPVKNILGAEAAGERGGLDRFTKIMFGAAYIDGRPDPGTRIDP